MIGKKPCWPLALRGSPMTGNMTTRPNRYAGASQPAASAKTLASTLLDKWYTKTDDEDTEKLLRDAEEEEGDDFLHNDSDYRDVMDAASNAFNSVRSEDD